MHIRNRIVQSPCLHCVCNLDRVAVKIGGIQMDCMVYTLVHRQRLFKYVHYKGMGRALAAQLFNIVLSRYTLAKESCTLCPSQHSMSLFRQLKQQKTQGYSQME